jgi:tetratricopeptide (TPR) repeat protein
MAGPNWQNSFSGPSSQFIKLSTAQLLAKGIDQLQRGQWAAAEENFKKIGTGAVEYPDALQFRGLIALETGRSILAQEFLSQFAILMPEFAPVLVNLALACQTVGQIAHAIRLLDHAAYLQPSLAPIWFNRGNVALVDFDRTGWLYFCRAMCLAPSDPLIVTNMIAGLQFAGLPQQAARLGECAVILAPTYAQAHINAGAAWSGIGDFDRALAACAQAMRLEPETREAYFNAGLVHLLLGNFDPGWSYYSRRLLTGPIIQKLAGIPAWDGRDPKSKRILIFCEQGLGDTIQFIRYVPLLVQQGAKIIAAVQRPLVDLLSSIDPNVLVINASDDFPPIDCHCSLMDLPFAFDTTISTVPARVPYLHLGPAELARADQLRTDLTRTAKFNIGLVWSGNSAHKNDRLRSIKFDMLEPLFQQSDIQFHRLQKDISDADRKLAGDIPNLTLHDEWLEGFTNTAILASALDLVISIDTSLIHLAGAFGLPVWVLLSDPPDWRWMLNRLDSPWYPSARLWRQDERREWGPVIDAVAHELSNLVQSAERLR